MTKYGLLDKEGLKQFYEDQLTGVAQWEAANDHRTKPGKEFAEAIWRALERVSTR